MQKGQKKQKEEKNRKMTTKVKYFIKTFGCAQNNADSERIASYLQAQGMEKSRDINKADYIVINTCMVRQMAEDRIYGLVNNISKIKNINKKAKKNIPKIILTGCMVGMAMRDKSGKLFQMIRKRLPQVDEFLPIEEIGFGYPPIRTDAGHAWVPISNGCNNFCTFCVVPFSRGREISRSYDEIISECKELIAKGCKRITLLGMNVNSYGADLIKSKNLKPIYVKNMGKLRIPTLFPHLLEEVAKIPGIELVDFLSSNPWDFSDELIDVIRRNSKITRTIHLPVQSGSNSVLRRMNRLYTRGEYLELAANLKSKIKNLKLSTDIIVGFCGETEKEFLETVDLAKKAGFEKAYVAMYSDRPMTAAHKAMKDDIPHKEKKRRWKILDDLLNQHNFSRQI